MEDFLDNNRTLMLQLEKIKETTTSNQYEIIKMLIKAAWYIGGMKSIREANSKLDVEIKKIKKNERLDNTGI